jgi:hypothetical protein
LSPISQLVGSIGGRLFFYIARFARKENTMTQSKKTLHRVVAMAVAIVVIQTFNLGIALAKPGLLQRAKDTVKKTEEGIETAKTVDAFAQYFGQFKSGSGLIDLWGRSFSHFLMIWLLTGTFALILFRWKRDKATSVGLWMKFFVAYAVGIAGGWIFELFRSFNRGGSGYTGLLTLAGLLMACSLLLYLPELLKFFQAIRKKEVHYFLRTWKLPPWVTGEAVAPTQADEAELPEGTEDEESADTAESQTEAPASDEASDAQPTDSSDTSDLVPCPHCNRKIGAKAKFCGHCTKPITGVSMADVPCPFCGKPTRPNAKFCGHCTKQLGASPAPRRGPLSLKKTWRNS